MKLKTYIISLICSICISACSKKYDTATLHIVNTTNDKWNVTIEAEELYTNFNLFGHQERSCIVLPGHFYVYGELVSDSWLQFDFASAEGTIKEGTTVTIELD